MAHNPCRFRFFTVKKAAEVYGITKRRVQQLIKIHRDTVSHVVEDLARHAREVTDSLIRDVELTEVQVDEMWSFVKKTKEG
jgi:hypothetical protein